MHRLRCVGQSRDLFGACSLPFRATLQFRHVINSVAHLIECKPHTRRSRSACSGKRFSERRTKLGHLVAHLTRALVRDARRLVHALNEAADFCDQVEGKCAERTSSHQFLPPLVKNDISASAISSSSSLSSRKCGAKSSSVYAAPVFFLIPIAVRTVERACATWASTRNPMFNVPRDRMYLCHDMNSTKLRRSFASATVRPPTPDKTNSCHSSSSGARFFPRRWPSFRLPC